MSAAYLFQEQDSRPTLTLLSPPGVADWAKQDPLKPGFSDSKHRIIDPVLPQNSSLEVLEKLRDTDKTDIPEVTDEEREYFRTKGTLSEFYFEILQPWRRRQLGRGEVAANTLTNERQSIRCFAEFDRISRPDNWPVGEPWEGRPMAYLAGKYFQSWLMYRLVNGSVRGPLSVGSIPKRWNHIRFVINQAFRLRITDSPISVSVDDVIDDYQADTEHDALDMDLIPTAFTESQLNAVYQQLDGDFELQTAWVVGASVGPRTGDLFALRWQRNIRLTAEPPDVVYLATKTKRKKRRLWVPLASIAIEHLKRLAKMQGHLGDPMGLVFPLQTDGHRKEPEDGERSRARTRKIKRAMVDAGITLTADTERPWQMLRSTVNSRLNDCVTGAGNRATHGQEASVQGVFYNDYRDMLIRAVSILDQQRLKAGIFRPR